MSNKVAPVLSVDEVREEASKKLKKTALGAYLGSNP